MSDQSRPPSAEVLERRARIAMNTLVRLDEHRGLIRPMRLVREGTRSYEAARDPE